MNNNLLTPPSLQCRLLVARLSLDLQRRPAGPGCCLRVGCELQLSFPEPRKPPTLAMNQEPGADPWGAHSCAWLCTGPETKITGRTFIGHLPPCGGLLIDSRWRDVGVNEVDVLAKCFPSSSTTEPIRKECCAGRVGRGEGARKSELSPKVLGEGGE